MQICQPAINTGVSYLRQQAKDNIKKYIDEKLSEEMSGWVECYTKRKWSTYRTEDRREKIQALSLAKECYSMKLDLLTNATVVDDAIRFVSDRSKEKLKSSSSSNDENHKGLNEPDYDEDEDQLKEDQEEGTGEVATTNQVF